MLPVLLSDLQTFQDPKDSKGGGTASAPKVQVLIFLQQSDQFGTYGCFQKIGVPQNGWFIMENPIKIEDLRVHLFLETPISSKHGHFFEFSRIMDHAHVRIHMIREIFSITSPFFLIHVQKSLKPWNLQGNTLILMPPQVGQHRWTRWFKTETKIKKQTFPSTHQAF